MLPFRQSVVVLSAILILTSVVSAKSLHKQPTTKCYYSADSTYFLEVIPAQDGNQGPAKPCHARLFHKSEHGDTLIRWERDLPNLLAPANAIVSPHGKYVVTFNDWWPDGLPENAVIAYGLRGECVARHPLADLLSEHDRADWKKYLDTTHAHIWVEDQPIRNVYSNTGNHIDETGDVLTLLMPMDYGASEYQGLAARDTVKVDLKTGRVLTHILRKKGARLRTADTLWTRSYPSRILESSMISVSNGLVFLFGNRSKQYTGIGKLDRHGDLVIIAKNEKWSAQGIALRPFDYGGYAVLCAGFESKDGHMASLGCNRATLFAVDSAGKEIWNTTWDYPYTSETLIGLVRTPNGEYIAAGNYYLHQTTHGINSALYLKRMVVLKDPGLPVLHDWQYAYIVPSVAETGKIMLASDSTLLISGGSTGDLAKVKCDGTPLWVDTLKFPIFGMAPLPDNGCAVVIANRDTSYVLRIASNGQILDRHRLSMLPSDRVCAITATRDGGYALAIRGQRFAESGEFVLQITDRQGNKLRESQAGTIWYDDPIALTELNDGFLMVGNNDHGIYAVMFRH